MIDKVQGGTLPADVIAAAVARMDWPAVRRVLQDVLGSQAFDWRQKAQLCASAGDWVGVLRAEPGVLAETRISHTEDLPPPLMRLAIQARHRLELFEEARDLSRIMRERMPGRPEWVRREADALFNLGEHQAALALGMEAWQARVDFAPMLVVRNLIALDELHNCRNFLEEVAAAYGGAEPPEALRSRIFYFEATDDHDSIVALMEKLRDSTPEPEYWSTMADAAARRLDGEALAEMLSMVAEWETRADALALYRQAAPAILQAHFKSFADWPRVRPFIRALAEVPLEPGPTTTVSAVLLQVGEYQAANEVVRRNLDNFPSSQGLWRRHLHILSLIGLAEDVTAARNRMREQFPKESYLAAVSIAEPRSWDDAELPELLRHNISGKNKNRQAKFFASLTEADLTDAQLQTLRDVAVNSTPSISAQFDLMLAAARDAHLLERAVVETVDFWDFKKGRGEVAERLKALTAQLPPDEPGLPPAAFGMADCLRLAEKIQKRERLPFLYTRESYADAARVASIIVRRIRQQSASSIIRLGDGEGHFLEGPAAVSGYREADRAQIQNIWWGSTRMRGAQQDKIIADFRTAVEKSDLLAILPPWRFVAEMQKADYTPVHRGIHSSIHHVANLKYDGLIVSMHFPNDLHKWGLWDEIFDACDKISYISCHDLGPVLLEQFGVQTQTAVHIPGERQFTALFDAQVDQEADDRVLLHRHEEIIEGLRPQRGEVFLVAAGFLGKIYCHVIKKRGGIGIDIGSLADYWMGFATRRYRLEAENDVGLLNIHINDHVLTDQAKPARIVGQSTTVRSSGNFRCNIAGLVPESTPVPLAEETRLVRAIGHPGCGAGSLAKLFQDHGVEVGHESLLRDGIASWSHAVRDLNVPNGDNATTAAFAHTFAYVRAPADAIPLIMLENGKGKSLYFRRQHIMRAFGVDLADYSSPLDRAVASLTFWYDIIFQSGVEQIIQIEKAPALIGDLLVKIGCDGTSADGTTTTAIALDAISAPQSAPKLTKACYRDLSGELRGKLEKYCELTGYDRPW